MKELVIVCFLLFWTLSESADPVIGNLPDSRDLQEDTSTEILIFTIAVTDSDGDTITCDFGPGSNPGVGSTRFSVRYIPGGTSWGVYTVASAGYDFNSQPTYDLKIKCEDTNGNSDTETFTVNLLENQRPVINNLPDTTSISVQTSGIGTSIFQVNVTDAENDVTALTVTCVPASPACPFQVFNSGDVVVSADITTTTITGYDVIIGVSDSGGNGSPETLTVVFTDLNSQPVIQNLGTTYSVAENGALGNTLDTATCTDSDVSDTVAYSMTCTPSTGIMYFQINATTGVISTSPTSSTNYEYLVSAGSTSFTCTVTCTDGNALDTASVVFDVTDVNEGPSFAQNAYSISVDEGAGGTALQASGYVINDEDNADTTTFTFDCGTTDTGYFSIDSNTGILSYGTEYDVDDGTRPTSVNCNVNVTDSGGLTDTTSLFITIDNINDNSPVFLQSTYSWFTSEASPTGTSLGAVSATDADAGAYGVINYSLDQTALGTDYFGVDHTGTVFVENSLAPLGGGVTATFDAIATDGGGNTTRVTITVVTIATTTTTTTTTTDRYKTFFEDTRNIVWFTACCMAVGITAIVSFSLCCSYFINQPPKPKKFFKCCKLWKDKPPKVKFEEPKKPEVIEIEPKPSPAPQGFQFWSSTNEGWNPS